MGDQTTIVQRIGEANADGLIILTAPTEGGSLARELARQGIDLPVLGNAPQASPSFFEAGGNEVSNWVLPSIFNAGRDDQQTQTYVKEMAQRDKEPPTIPEAVNYYDGVYLIAEAMRNAEITSDTPPEEAREAIKEQLLAIDGFSGAAGEISFAGSSDAVKTVYVNVINDGEIQSLESASG